MSLSKDQIQKMILEATSKLKSDLDVQIIAKLDEIRTNCSLVLLSKIEEKVDQLRLDMQKCCQNSTIGGNINNSTNIKLDNAIKDINNLKESMKIILGEMLRNSQDINNSSSSSCKR